MPRIPDAVAVASLDTHRLIVAVRNDGHADVTSNLAPRDTAHVLRQIADRYEQRAGQCARALATGLPCPVHDAPASPSEALPAAGTGAAEAAARGIRQVQRPAGLDALLAQVAAAMSPAAEEPDALTADDVRAALAFNSLDRDPALATLRDVLLDDAPCTPEQALAAARLILRAHAWHIAALVDREYDATRSRWGLNRSTRGLLTGYSGARCAIQAYADRLADEQALAEGAANEQAQP
ncbi:hypothetical protein GCM10010252_19130 [Streptomyces aureoverticillatus]|nr:hypothetical protein GCM10010252_19130 [Streptomyces aureoverticillatus]